MLQPRNTPIMIIDLTSIACNKVHAVHSPPLDSDCHHLPGTATQGEELKAQGFNKALEAGVSSQTHTSTITSQRHTQGCSWLDITTCTATLCNRWSAPTVRHTVNMLQKLCQWLGATQSVAHTG